jgi:hypothetical protein
MKDEIAMRNTKQNLSTAIAELHCLSPDRPASLEELTALSTARDCIDQLMRDCVAQLREDHPPIAWSEIATVLGTPSAAAARQRYGSEVAVDVAGTGGGSALGKTGVKYNAPATERALMFWLSIAERFSWGFLPVGFVHALYVEWMNAEFPAEQTLGRTAFTGRLKPIAAATATGEWRYMRLRAASLLGAPEPLCARVPAWSVTDLEKAQYGFLRVGPVTEVAAA